MSDKGDKDDDKKQSQSEIKNGVEKLIKIDKKHANFEFIDPLLNTKVKVRNINSSTSSSILGQNQPENTLRCFWRHINRYYFRRLDANEIERLSYLDQLFSYKQDTTLNKQKYANHMVYTAIQEVLDKERYINDQQQSPEVQKIIYKIVKASCNIQALIYECHFKDKANQKFIDQIIKEKDQILPKKGSKKKSVNELQNELTKLKAIEEKLLKKVEQSDEQIADNKPNKKKNGNQKKGSTNIEQDSDDSNQQNDDNISTASNDEISYYAKHGSRTLEQELERLVKQLDEVNAFNKQNQKKISQKSQLELKEGKLIYFENQNDSSTVIANGKQPPQQAQQQTKQKKKSKKNNEYSSDHVDAGIVDTFPKFGGFQKELGKDPRPKMTDKELSDLHLDYLQQLIFNLEEKQVADSISKITNCKKESKKEYNYEVMFEDALNSQPIYIDEKTLLRFNEFREHSMLKKYNLPVKTLFSSTSHNFAQLTQFVTNRNQLNQIKDSEVLDIMKKNSHLHHDAAHHTILNLTRNFDICHHCRQVFDLGYLIKCNYRSSVMDGELVCKRKFCVHCLKQNYDFKHDHSKIDWVCPFCQNYCHCIRCLRNEMINKLKGIYLLYGGDIQYLEQESLLNKYLRPLSEDDRKRKEREDIHHKATNSSMIAFQVQKQTYQKDLEQEKTLQSKLDDLTDVRLDMERVRLVISQVCRREKLKHLKFIEDQDIYRQKEQSIQKSLKKKAAKLAKKEEKEQKEPEETKKSKSSKSVNGASKKQNKIEEVETKKNKKKSKKIVEVSEEENEAEESQQSMQEEESSSQEEEIEDDEEEEEQQSNSAASDSAEIEEESDEDQEEQEEEEEEDEEQAEAESSSQEIEGEEEDAEEASDSDMIEEEEQEENSSEVRSQISSEADNDESDEEEQEASEAQSEVDEEEASENGEQEVSESGEEDEEEEDATEQEEDEDDQESEEQEVIESDESTVEENERSKSKKKETKSNKQKKQIRPSEKIPIKNEKTRSKSKVKEVVEEKSKKNQMNGKTKKEDKSEAAKDKKQKNENKPKSSSKKSNDNKNKDSKFIKRTKGSKDISKLLNSKITINKEIKNLLRNQDPLILQMTSQKEKALRSNMIPTESNHNDNKHSDIPNGNSKHLQNKNNNHKKQNISKYEQTPKKKVKN